MGGRTLGPAASVSIAPLPLPPPVVASTAVVVVAAAAAAAFEGPAPPELAALFFPDLSPSAASSAGRLALSAAAFRAFTFRASSLDLRLCNEVRSRLDGSVLTTWLRGGDVLWSAM